MAVLTPMFTWAVAGPVIVEHAGPGFVLIVNMSPSHSRLDSFQVTPYPNNLSVNLFRLRQAFFFSNVYKQFVAI